MISEVKLSAAAEVRRGAALLSGETALLDAEILFRYAAGWTRTKYVANSEVAVDSEVVQKFNEFLMRRAKHEPVAYITNSKEFFGRDFFVDSRVLVPRPETELLVEEALKFLKGRSGLNVLELATGSGCVAASVQLEAGEGISSFVASDISPDALDVAALNFSRYGLLDKIQLCSSDWFSSIYGRFDLILANPPYVELGANLAPDLGFEPNGALFSGVDGLNDIRFILKKAPLFLVPGGKLIFEFGAGQEKEIAKLAPAVQFIPDLSWRPRLAVFG
jgi:release factor glutamine methyltransferase